jgi:hypothetical protein
MKKFTFTLAASCLLFVSAQAGIPSSLTATEIKSVDLSGKYVGKRHQYAEDHKTIMQTFEYEFELKQSGNIVTGVSTIIKENGDYADINLRGMIVGDKFYFEEYEIKNQAKDPNYVWCFKTGQLSIQKDGDRLKLAGPTDSYMAEYFLPCTGGVTDLTKVDNSNNFSLSEGSNARVELPGSSNVNLNVSPNPFVNNTSISYSLTENSAVTLEVFDITGKRVATLENGSNKNAGSYTIPFSAQSSNIAAGVLIAKLTIDDKVYSSEMVQMK